MRPTVNHGSFREDETSAVRWVSFEEAPNLIAETPLAAGRARDLAVLSAARVLVEGKETP